MSGTLVSVVLPTYNRASLLGHAIRSVLRQSHRELELIVVDDHSGDHTPDVVRSFHDPRLHYVRHQRNLRLPGALNTGFALAKGHLLTWTSDDNLYAEQAIERMVAVLQTARCDFVYADYFDFARHHDATGEPIEPRRVRLPAALRLAQENSVGACFMYTRAVFERVGPYDPELFLVEDYDYFIRIEKRGFSMRHIPEPLYYFSRHDDSLFCSRYAEVQAAGVLVRYKNRLLDPQSATDACVEVVMSNPASLANPVLRTGYRIVKRSSYRLTRAFERAVRLYVQRKMACAVADLLERFSSRALSFPQAKDALRQLLQGVARLQYK